MKVTQKNIDNLNAVLEIEVAEDDYKNKVEKILEDYRKKANIPGFRKGKVPMSLIRKQYEQSVVLDEVNSLLQEAINKHLTDNKVEVLGNPLPKYNENFSWDNPTLNFEFELGLAPKFEVDLQPKKAITKYKIVADDKIIDDQINNIKQQYGIAKEQDKITKDSNVTGTFVNEEKEINNKSTFSMSRVKDASLKKALLGKKVGDKVTLKTKNLFDDDHYMQHVLGVSHDDAHGLDVNIDFTVENISKTEKAELNQELFDKLFGKDQVKSEKELKDKLKEVAEKQLEQQADQHLLNAVTDALIENTKFDLPAEFLQKWMVATSENPITPEQAKEQYKQSEKGLRYQLVEGKIIKDNNLQVTFDELKDHAKNFIKAQMAQYGNLNPDDKELDEIALKVLQNQEEAKKLQDQIISQKLLKFYKDKVKLKEKKINYDDFVKEVYK
jgi:trigger factor